MTDSEAKLFLKQVSDALARQEGKIDTQSGQVAALTERTDQILNRMEAHRNEHQLLDGRVKEIEDSCRAGLKDHEEKDFQRDKETLAALKETFDEKFSAHRKQRAEDVEVMGVNIAAAHKSANAARDEAQKTNQKLQKIVWIAGGIYIGVEFVTKFGPALVAFMGGGTP